MTEKRSHCYIQGQGHLRHMTPRWTRLVIGHMDVLKGVNISLKLQYLFK